MPITPPHAAPTWPAAKVAPPQPRVLVTRPRLLAPLHAATSEGGVVLVVAPGGTGKTLLLADWVRQAHLPVAWYALDRADRDPSRLAAGLCAAIDRAIPGAAEQARAALAAGAQEAAVIGVLLGAIEHRRLALVLDDFHHLDDHPETMALWDHLLRFRPSGLSLIVLTRTVPLLGFSALAALDELTGMGLAELRFDADETSALLSAHHLDATHAVQFATRSGGWAAGVLLLARTAANGVRFLRARTETLMEHLGREVVGSLPADLRTFLMESAALGPCRAEDADAVLVRQDSAAYYAEVAARGLFLDQDDGLYRYHDLFAEYLRGVLASEDPARLRAIRRAAAERCSALDDVPRGLALLAEGEDWDALAAMLERERVTLWRRGLGGTVLLHLEHLPRTYHTPRLLALGGYARLRRAEYTEALTLADAGMAHATNDDEWLSPAVLRVHALMQAGRDDEAVRSAEAALAVARAIQQPAAETTLRELRGMALLHAGQLDEGQADLLAVLAVHEASGDENGQARALSNLSASLIAAGQAAIARDYLDRADALLRGLVRTTLHGEIRNSRAMLGALTGDLVVARQEAEQAREIAREMNHLLLECAATATLAEVCADSGDAAAASAYAETARDMAERLDMPDALNDALRARIAGALIRRDRSGARRLIDEAQPFMVADVDQALLALLDGSLALRSRAYRRAADLLHQAAERLEAVHRPQSAARASLLAAEAHLAIGAIRRAEDALNHMASTALTAGCEGHLRPAARFARHVMAQRRILRRLRRETRSLLDRLAAAAPSMVVVPQSPESALPPTLWLSPFGAGRIRLGADEVPPDVLSAKARELLFFAGRAGAGLTRDILLDALWDGDTQCSYALWNASRDLRRLLGEGNWERHGATYALRLPVHDEGRRFFAAVADALDAERPMTDRIVAAEAALHIAGAGDYLSWCESLWAMRERNHVARSLMTVTLTLASLHDAEGRHTDAIAISRRAVAGDPFDEAARLALIRRLAVAGASGDARREYTSYRRLLRSQLKEEPSAEMRAVAAQLG